MRFGRRAKHTRRFNYDLVEIYKDLVAKERARDPQHRRAGIGRTSA